MQTQETGPDRAETGCSSSWEHISEVVKVSSPWSQEGGEDRGREGGHVLLKKTEMIKEKHVTKGHIVQYFFIGFPLDVRVCVCDCA